jgi:hypothetical protein
MLYNEKDIPELHQFYHINDSLQKNYIDYENRLLDKSLSPYLFGSPIMSGFLSRLTKLVSLFFDSFNIMKNWKNFTVDKYWYKSVN